VHPENEDEEERVARISVILEHLSQVENDTLRMIDSLQTEQGSSEARQMTSLLQGELGRANAKPRRVTRKR
jgi:predicted AAA+ superfamily ATPase